MNTWFNGSLLNRRTCWTARSFVSRECNLSVSCEEISCARFVLPRVSGRCKTSIDLLHLKVSLQFTFCSRRVYLFEGMDLTSFDHLALSNHVIILTSYLKWIASSVLSVQKSWLLWVLHSLTPKCRNGQSGCLCIYSSWNEMARSGDFHINIGVVMNHLLLWVVHSVSSLTS